MLEKYREHNVDISKIEEVDFVWSGEKYSELTGKQDYYDWVIASHLIEHVPDLIGFIIQCEEILRADGVLSLVIPDKRYCFDHYRPITGISKVIDSHLQGSVIHSAGTVAEYYLNVVGNSGDIAWTSGSKSNYNLLHDAELAIHGMEAIADHNAYIDVHAWCFVPHSFRLLIHDLNTLGFISMKEVSFFPTFESEFCVTLGKKGKGIQSTRLEFLEVIELEQNGEIE